MRKRIVAPVLAVLITATLGSATPPPPPPECVVAAAWVRAHPGELPTTLAEMSRYSMLYRRAIYDALPPATRQAMWREQVEGFLSSAQNLTGTQRAVAREALDALPALTVTHPDRAAAERLRDRLLANFDRRTVKRVFATLGPLPAREPQPANAKRPLCDCESDYDCFGGGTCTYVLCSFTGGCGPYWSYTCTGVCR